LHFKWQDLLKFKNIALPGAVGQTLVATIFGIVLIQWMGWSFEAGILFGLAIGVASTVVLVRILTDNHLLNTQQGHIAVGWLIVEDLITIAALLLVPSLAYSINGKDFPLNEVFFSFALSLFKFLLLTVAMFTMGQKVISFVLAKVYFYFNNFGAYFFHCDWFRSSFRYVDCFRSIPCGNGHWPERY
jgi:monovalent cation:H+ antiporter-2, CPA2 family